jgi:glyoxylase-like metal-dependent hydrolase (beta-lactamase superfamily II)
MYEIFALRVTETKVDGSTIFFQEPPGKMVNKAFYFFCLKNKEHTYLLDTGISPSELELRKLPSFATREELLATIGVRPVDIEAVILTHIHSDHFTESEIYPRAFFYVQRKEFQFWSGDIQRFHYLAYPPFTNGKPVADIDTLGRYNYLQRVRFLDGDSDILPGIRGIWCGAHTPGSQCVEVQTMRGKVLCCSDFFDCYRNLDEQIPVGVLTSLEEWLQGYGKIERMYFPRENIIPGHDPQIFKTFSKVSENVVKIA